MKLLKTLMLAFILAVPGITQAQDSTEMKTRAFQLSFITPLGTNGLQCAGFSNVVAGPVSGVQISGLFNFARKLKGVQIAPFNYVDSLEKGVTDWAV
ncbi:MAG: hypothetical protein ABIJ04_07955 [Bacteroidota bacterium]